MRIVVAKPPLFSDICAVFPLAAGDVVFAWGPTIYNPRNVTINPEILAHEQAHGRRQGSTDGSIEAWWREYLASPTFRLTEELIGHQAELQALKDAARDRNRHAWAALHVASKLSAPLYGLGITRPEAMKLLMARAA
jgi:hypothetical protein